MISYKPLWKLLIEKDLKKLEFAALCSISTATLAKLSKNDFVSMDVLCKICSALDCQFGDIVEYQK
ncbi:MAG: helix-turn-helix domain-containing protein [Aminipila sp.]